METANKNYVPLKADELEDIYGGIPWGVIGKYALRAAVGAAGVGTGVGTVLAVGYAAYEICDALDVF